MVTPARRGKHFLYIEFSLLVVIGCENIRSLITSCSKREHSGFRIQDSHMSPAKRVENGFFRAESRSMSYVIFSARLKLHDICLRITFICECRGNWVNMRKNV